MLKNAFLIAGWVAAAIAFNHLAGLSWMSYPATNESAREAGQQMMIAQVLCGVVAVGGIVSALRETIWRRRG
jgi:hypothetical protein